MICLINDLKDHRVLIGAPGKSPVRVGLLLAASSSASSTLGKSLSCVAIKAPMFTDHTGGCRGGCEAQSVLFPLLNLASAVDPGRPSAEWEKVSDLPPGGEAGGAQHPEKGGGGGRVGAAVGGGGRGGQ